MTEITNITDPYERLIDVNFVALLDQGVYLARYEYDIFVGQFNYLFENEPKELMEEFATIWVMVNILSPESIFIRVKYQHKSEPHQYAEFTYSGRYFIDWLYAE